MPERHACFDKIDEMLAERNTRLEFPIMLGSDQTALPMVRTEQIETGRGKKKACGMFATFCPFCGESLREGTAQ